MIANKIAKYFTPVVTSLINARLPRIIAIEATNTCFLECVTCPIPHTMTRSKGNMSLATFKTLLGQIDWKIDRLSWAFGGEPLLNEDVWQMVSLARDKGIASKVDTNGMLIGRYKDEIFKSGLEILNIAFEGLSEKSTTRFRAGYDYRLVVNNIKMLCDQKRKLGVRNPSIALNFLVRKDNEDEIRRAIELMREWKVDVVTLKSINISPSAWLTDERIQYLGNEFLPVKNTRFSRYARKGGKWVPKPYISDFCRYLPNSVTITWDGKVLPCCFDYDSSMVAGNIHDRSLRTIWRSGEFKDIRRKVYKGSPPLCKNCTSVSLQKKITLG